MEFSSNRVLESTHDIGECNSQTDNNAGDTRTRPSSGDHAGKAEKGRADPQHPGGRMVYALLRPIERRMPLAGVLLAERLPQDEGVAKEMTC